MTWQDDQKRVATGVTDGTDGRKYSTVFPYEPWPVRYNCRLRMGQNGVTWYDEKGNVTMHIDSQNGVTVSKRVDDDDDIQDYKRPWVGLTKNDLQPICDEYRIIFGSWVEDFARAIEAKLKEKNA